MDTEHLDEDSVTRGLTELSLATPGLYHCLHITL